MGTNAVIPEKFEVSSVPEPKVKDVPVIYEEHAVHA